MSSTNGIPSPSRARVDSFRPATPNTMKLMFGDDTEINNLASTGPHMELQTVIDNDPEEFTAMRRSRKSSASSSPPSLAAAAGGGGGLGSSSAMGSSSLPIIREDLGDDGDVRRCFDRAWWMGLFGGAAPLMNRVVKDAGSTWSRRFSDVEDGFAGRSTRTLGSEKRGTVEDLRRSYLANSFASMDIEDTEVELIRKEDFCMKLAVALHSYGCPIPRTEYTLSKLLEHLEVAGGFYVLPSMIWVSFGQPVSASSETHILRASSGLDCYKLRKVNHLCNNILRDKIKRLPDAIVKLDRIIAEPPLYSPKMMILAYAISSGTVAPLFFKGSLLDGLWATLIGAMVGVLLVLCDSSYLLGKTLLLTAATSSSFFATLIANHVGGTCSFAIHFGPITFLLPGWSITTSVIELSTQNMISGTTRMFTALMNAMLLGFGLDVGNRLGGGGDWGRATGCPSVDNYTKIPLFFATVMSYHVLMKAAPAQFVGMTVVGMISFTLINYGSTFLSPSSSSILTAFAICVAGNLYAHLTNSPGLIPILSGVFLIVPGSMGVKGVHALLSNDFNSGMQFGFAMLLTAVSISTGLFAASILTYRVRAKVSNAVFF